MRNKFGLFGGIALAVLASVSVVSGQEKPPTPGDVIIYKGEQHRMGLGHRHPVPPGGDSFFFASEMSFGGKLVKGAPYSAEAITEHTQTLSDGNRIVNRSTAAVYRDSEGRSRSEHTFRPPFAIEGAPRTIHISDPVAAVSYLLHPGDQVAHKLPPVRFKSEFKTSPANGVADIKEHFEVKVRSDSIPDPAIDEQITTIGVAINRLDNNNRNSRRESLGKQDIGGVEAEGVRTTVTIPAGDIGNERPIEIVSERWYSPELQIVVMTKHIDPRSGEDVYRLTNIVRSEPARSLFEVPASYRIEGPGPVPGPGQKVRLRKPADEQ